MDKEGIEFAIFDAELNMEKRLSEHSSVCVGVSGGSDSNIIVHMIATKFRKYLPKIHFVFQNTGIEYDATLRHLDYMEKRYDIRIDRIKGEPVPLVIKEYGVPILSKAFSNEVSYAQKGSEWALKRIERTREESKFAMSKTQKALAKYLVENDIKISDACCVLSKKKPYKKQLKAINADLTITGERRSEGGQRATRHKGCFERATASHIDKFMPLWYWDDETKAYYKEREGIKFSDCYEVWGMERTGCVGCPYNSRAGEDLKKLKKYEPQKYKLCMSVFGISYRLMDEFGVHRHKILEEK